MSPDSSSCTVPDLAGKVFIVTGGNAGIGRETVMGLASHGARVYMGGRSKQKAMDAIVEIKEKLPSADIQYLHLDLSNLESVTEATQTLLKRETALHGLVNNAGIMGVPFSKTKDGYEIQFQVGARSWKARAFRVLTTTAVQTNYLSHFLLTKLLLPLLLSTAKSSSPGSVRIVNVTSDGHQIFENKGGICFDDIELKSVSTMKRYGQSKLANILHAKELNRMFGPESPGRDGKIWVAAVHPGHIDTDLGKQATGVAPTYVLRIMRFMTRLLRILDEPERGASSSLWAIASKDFEESSSGAYIVPYMKIGKPSAAAMDGTLASKLWNWTEDQLRQKRLLG
ncbi:hypothetical protein PV08_07061 [Exophiala spinifera]|uniref:Ketoreductase (KR) domain-containing protein n=1 Tax=Exophiala spinifera TaxID=91928 RepID=A0A0D2BSM5_9EURO|nr:uncharacterized protein PV08_07061 [Exophiala spinifera]KIW14279.1 hypothetical protein PV08_07061 [Exophiala spinifera]